VRPGGLAAQPFRVVPGGDEQHRGGVRSDAVEAEQGRRAGGDERDDQVVQALDWAPGNSTRRPSSRSAMRSE
jgi:hypothetical protein